MALSDKYNILFIHIPKNAGTALIDGLGLSPHGHYSWRNHPRFNYNYYKFAIVRNPWDRVVSAYEFAKMDKSYWHSKDNQTKHPDYDLCQTLTFKECVELLLKNPSKLKHQGWGSQHFYVAKEEKIMVDSILKMENLDKELKEMFVKLNINKIPYIPKSNTSTRTLDYKKYYDEETKQIIAEKYKKDIKLFNYTL